MKELLETIARALVQNPDDVNVVEENKDGEIVLTLSVNEQDRYFIHHFCSHGAKLQSLYLFFAEIGGNLYKNL